MSLSLDKNDIKQKISKVSTKTDLETFRLQFLGKKGFLTQEMKSLSFLSTAEKKTKGQKLNQIKLLLLLLVNMEKEDIHLQVIIMIRIMKIGEWPIGIWVYI